MPWRDEAPVTLLAGGFLPIPHICGAPHMWGRLLLDSRVVDVPMAYNSTLVMRSSLKPLLFNSLKNEVRFSGNAGAEAPGIQ